ncbi:transcriptional regulator, partial [Parageobacillus sp. SY1]
QKTGKGGRPSRLYRLSDKVIQLHFPFRDYQLLSKIAIQTMAKLGDVGKQALYETGKNFGKELVAQRIPHDQSVQELTFAEKAEIVKEAAEAAGLYPTFEYNEKEGKIYLQVFNCPFKEIAFQEPEIICQMHYAFLQGMFEVLFPNVELVEMENMIKGCDCCSYRANLVK